MFASTTGELDLTDDQKADMMSFIKDDGKGFVGIHAALDTNYKWPEYGEMIGGWFDQHPWMTFNAPIITEDPNFPAVRHFPHAFMKRDEIYQAKDWSRDKVNVLLSLDATSSITTIRASIARSRLCRCLVEDVRQRPRVLFDPGTHERSLGRSGHHEDVLRSDQVGPGDDGRQHESHPQCAEPDLANAAAYGIVTRSGSTPASAVRRPRRYRARAACE